MYALSRVVKFARSQGLVVFAEDAGDRLKELRMGLHKLKVPGIRMMRFAYNEKRKTFEDDYADVKSYPARSFAYTTTHDTETLMGYVSRLTPAERKALCERVGIRATTERRTLAGGLREAVLTSSAQVRIIPLQDWLLSYDRINIPGTEKMKGDRNWRYRLPVPIEQLPVRSIRSVVASALRRRYK